MIDPRFDRALCIEIEPTIARTCRFDRESFRIGPKLKTGGRCRQKPRFAHGAVERLMNVAEHITADSIVVYQRLNQFVTTTNTVYVESNRPNLNRRVMTDHQDRTGILGNFVGQ